MNMENRNTLSQMQNLLVDFHSFLSKHVFTWIITENQKKAISHVLSVIKPRTLRDRLDSDFAFPRYQLRKDFKKFLNHIFTLSEAFQIVYAS